MRTSWTIRTGVGLILALALGVFAGWHVFERRDRERTARLVTPTGATLVVEVAATPAQRALGLSSRPELTTDGLWLQWPTADAHPIWMRDMRFPLDLVWLDRDLRVITIARDASPCPDDSCPLLFPASADATSVLELAADRAAGLGLRPGTALRRVLSVPPSSLPRS